MTAQLEGEIRTQIREVGSQNGFRSQSSLVQHFGLGEAETATEVSVRWPSGSHSRIENVKANQQITMTEESP